MSSASDRIFRKLSSKWKRSNFKPQATAWYIRAGETAMGEITEPNRNSRSKKSRRSGKLLAWAAINQRYDYRNIARTFRDASYQSRVLRLRRNIEDYRHTTTDLEVRTFRGANRRSVDPPVDNSSGAPLPTFGSREKKSVEEQLAYLKNERRDKTGSIGWKCILKKTGRTTFKERTQLNIFILPSERKLRRRCKISLCCFVAQK